MKKVWIGILATLLLASVVATSAVAAGQGSGRYFVDTDSDGICDYAETFCGDTETPCGGYCRYSRHAFCGDSGVCAAGRGAGQGNGFRHRYNR